MQQCFGQVLILLSFLFCPLAFTAPPPSGYPATLSADHLSFEEGQTNLEGDVSIQSPFGSIEAEHVIIDHRQKAGPFPSMRAWTHVAARMHSGAQLFCDIAEYNANSLQGSFSAKNESSRILYQDPSISSLPFQLSCSQITLFCEEDPLSSQLKISHLNAWKNISVFYDQEFSAKADKAIIQPDSNEEVLLVALPQEQNTCRINRSNGDQVDSQTIRFSKQSLSCSQPRAQLFLPSEVTAFQLVGSLLEWEREEDFLECYGPSELTHPNFGKLSSEGKISISRPSQAKTSTQMEKILAEGPTLYSYQFLANKKVSEISCDGTISIDFHNGKLFAKGDAQPVTYTDGSQLMQAESAILDFDMIDGQVVPRNFFLQGHVLLKSSPPGDFLTPSVHNKYAICDQLDFNLDTGAVLLSSASTQPVLYIDEVKGLTMSAPSIQLFYDMTQGAISSAQGLGAVRFNLSSNEQEIIRKTFKQESVE